MSAWTYLSGLLISLLAWLGFEWGGAWTLLFPAVIFGVVPVLELFTAPDPSNFEGEALKARQGEAILSALALLALPIQYCLLWRFLTLVSAEGSLSVVTWVGATLSMGIACGAYGINVAHELGHRLSERDRFASKALLLSTLYMHFFIEHNRGHHARVATPDDPASAAEGEVVYLFWWRSLFGGLRSAWRLEAKRLSKRGLNAWSLHNQALRFHLIQLTFVALIGWQWGAFALGSFMVAALIGALLLETVNYLEHYGLQRAAREGGGYEPVRPLHSWNADHPIGRALLFELTRHSDHHAYPKRTYGALRHHPQSLQLPTGYTGMILLSLLPPVFIPYMRRHLKRELERLGLESTANAPSERRSPLINKAHSEAPLA